MIEHAHCHLNCARVYPRALRLSMEALHESSRASLALIEDEAWQSVLLRRAWHRLFLLMVMEGEHCLTK